MTAHKLTAMQIFNLASLSIAAAGIAALMGILLIAFGRFQKVRALDLWGAGYILGGVAGATWGSIGWQADWLVQTLVQAAGLLACGLVFGASRIFHGRSIRPLEVGFGAALWLGLALATQGALPSVLLLALGVAILGIYVALTVRELLRERRKVLRGRWPVIAISALHGALLLLPIIAGIVVRAETGAPDIATGWIAAFAIELVIYLVASAFVLMLLVTQRTLQNHRNAALTDPLTGLLNRRGFAEAGVVMVAQEERKGRSISVLLCDLDRFKAVNDTYGHGAGDELLRVFARTLSANVRTGDLIARVGGEEFAIAMACTVGEAAIAADRVRGVYADVDVSIGGDAVETTVSVGVASGRPGTPVDLLIACADVALYRAKRKGRNRVEIAEEDPFALNAARMRISQVGEPSPEVRVGATADLVRSSR